MALVVKIEDGDLRLAFWQLTEDVDVLVSSALFTDDDRKEYLLINHEKRKREFVASRAALRIGLENASPVLYEPNGKPYLTSSALSLSHCLPIAGALTHPLHAGFDIQIPDQKLHTIRHRFAHADELEAALKSSSELDYLTLLWSAKEAVFKVFGEQLTFASDILIRPFQINDSRLMADVLHAGRSYSIELTAFKVCGLWVVAVTHVTA
ncbi:MAG: 4'-phosphopantetheinyl transferase superfamily protein [Cryomorphaceae bacterium]|nr:4'-phosphopantetheinyl transferase superfamily protein [Cryomorphaceae bacterium]